MADTKITALTAISTVDPAVDVFPIVDVSDTTMAASGTTKKITSNQLLGAGGTATLASATITGDLTAARLNVTGATVPANGVYLVATNKIAFSTNSTKRFTIDDFGNLLNSTTATQNGFLQFDNSIDGGTLGYVGNAKALISGGSTSSVGIRGESSVQFAIGSNLGMTLNSTGLGVGGSPVNPITAYAAASAKAPALLLTTAGSPTYGWDFSVDGAVNGNLFIRSLVAGTKTDVLEFDRSNGNLGLGVTPSAWNGVKAIQIPSYGSYAFGASGGSIPANAYYDGAWKYIANGYATKYDTQQGIGAHLWYTAPSGTAGNAITFTQAMTLDASGILAIGTVALGYTSSKSTYFSPVVGYWIGNHTTGTPSGDRYWGFGYGINEVGSITQDGTTGVLYNTTSDYRLKESVQPLSGGLARVNALKPSIYKWKVDGSNGEGFLAHELAAVVPFAVTGEKDAVNEDGSIKAQSIDMSRVVPILVAAIQELTARVQTLETR